MELAAIEPLRALHLQELNAQVRYDAVHRRGWSDSYALTVDGAPAGYGSLTGDLDRRPRETVFEYYVTPPFRRRASVLFAELLARSSAARIECQSNDPQLSAMLFEFADEHRGGHDPVRGPHDRIASDRGRDVPAASRRRPPVRAHGRAGGRLRRRARRGRRRDRRLPPALQRAVRRRLHGGRRRAPAQGRRHVPRRGRAPRVLRRGPRPGGAHAA